MIVKSISFKPCIMYDNNNFLFRENTSVSFKSQAACEAWSCVLHQSQWRLKLVFIKMKCDIP